MAKKKKKPNALGAKSLVEKITLERARSIDQLLIAAKAPSHTRFVCVTDGSGSSRSRPGGWGGAIVDLHSREATCVGGSAWFSTSQEAEIRAVVEVLNHLVASGEGDRTGGCHVLLIVDSKYAAQKINDIANNPLAAMDFNQHTVMLAGIQAAMRVGVTFQAAHIARNTNTLMIFADKSSKISRKSVPSEEIFSLLNEEVVSAEHKFQLARKDQ